ncbi:MAG: DUF2182 domain-containing protein [Armatimonadetes bacterium]|nr:DUF2182 domain-containing protein [Armatimonadota bacterium]
MTGSAAYPSEPRDALAHRPRVVVGVTLGVAAAVSWSRLMAGAAMDPGMDAGLFLVMWFWMVGAMMLPAIAPMVATCDAILRTWQPRGRGVRLGAFVVAYVVLWTAAGGAAFAVRMITQGRPGVVAALLAVAGLYQLGTLKASCLRHCRSPIEFFLQHGAAISSVRGAFATGLHHGVLCLGCCAGLMIALTAVGAMDLAWMAAFAVLILLEKVHPAGPALSRASGLVLVASAPLALTIPHAVTGPLSAGVALLMLAASAVALRRSAAAWPLA